MAPSCGPHRARPSRHGAHGRDGVDGAHRRVPLHDHPHSHVQSLVHNSVGKSVPRCVLVYIMEFHTSLLTKSCTNIILYYLLTCLVCLGFPFHDHAVAMVLDETEMCRGKARKKRKAGEKRFSSRGFAENPLENVNVCMTQLEASLSAMDPARLKLHELVDILNRPVPGGDGAAASGAGGASNGASSGAGAAASGSSSGGGASNRVSSRTSRRLGSGTPGSGTGGSNINSRSGSESGTGSRAREER